ncbi:copper chaperone PCu(A)C [Histidinibacterium lentulum]|uniref:Copper chaperone PCu(A)C n=1 Tax=Histidinibacterium lentulum TaxID=2480588 RepID=A0A3N2QW98_9RHOB|nr:copper chaperone PCu(A)C [Histidinibacterium lentulum]ROT99409.1 copper chaperone PCu(A)C [Histidinibacterium lentulum]
MRLLPILALTLLPLAAFADDSHDHDHDHDTDDHLTEAEGLRIIHGWARASDGPEAQVFMEIENTRDDTVVLTGAEADWAGAARLVGAPISVDGGTVPLEEMEIAAGTTFDLTPDTVYVLVEDLAAPLQEGDTVEIEVEFAEIGHVEIAVEVEAADARQHSHAGHSH